MAFSFMMLIPMPCLALNGAKPSVELTDRCGFAVSSNAGGKMLMADGRHSTAWTASGEKDQYIRVALPGSPAAAGVYVMWNTVPKAWTLEGLEGGQWTEIELGPRSAYINAYIPLGEGVSKIRISADWKLSVAEVRLFGRGDLPEGVQVWEPTAEKADLMVVSAHPDDEHIYFGGVLPTYAGQLGKSTVVVYMTSSPMIRKFEALDGLWKVGVRQYPVFLPLANKYTSTVEEAELAWDGLDNTVALLVEQMRRCRPDVVVTHDLGGEYGHGAHKLTALSVTKAVKASAGEGSYRDSFGKYGPWQVKKCYLHLYEGNRVKIDWRAGLSAFGGRTALQMAQEGYDMHVSQHFRERPVVDSGEYDNSLFGLYYSSVGPDTGKNDLFEHLESRAATASPQPSKPAAKPTAGRTEEIPAPSPTQDSIPAIAPAGPVKPGPTDGSALLRAALVLAGAAFFTVVLLRFRQPGRRTQPPVCFSDRASHR